MREIHRVIASTIIFSKDGKVLMGQKDKDDGGVYANCWHIPGGGIDEGESLEEAAIREVYEETGFVITKEQLKRIEEVGEGSSEKRLKDTGEVVMCHMKFNRFEVQLDQVAEEIQICPPEGSDLVSLKWFSKTELREIEQIPSGKEFFLRQGYIEPLLESKEASKFI